jgi:hypothetical protein
MAKTVAVRGDSVASLCDVGERLHDLAPRLRELVALLRELAHGLGERAATVEPPTSTPRRAGTGPLRASCPRKPRLPGWSQRRLSTNPRATNLFRRPCGRVPRSPDASTGTVLALLRDLPGEVMAFAV